MSEQFNEAIELTDDAIHDAVLILRHAKSLISLDLVNANMLDKLNEMSAQLTFMRLDLLHILSNMQY